MIMEIMKKLDLISVRVLGSVNKRFNILANDFSVYECILLKPYEVIREKTRHVECH